MRAAFEKDTTAVISTNSDLGRMLKSMAEAVAPPKPASLNRPSAAAFRENLDDWPLTRTIDVFISLLTNTELDCLPMCAIAARVEALSAV